MITLRALGATAKVMGIPQSQSTCRGRTTRPLLSFERVVEATREHPAGPNRRRTHHAGPCTGARVTRECQVDEYGSLGLVACTAPKITLLLRQSDHVDAICSVSSGRTQIRRARRRGTVLATSSAPIRQDQRTRWGAMIHGESVKSTDGLANPNALEQFAAMRMKLEHM